MEELLTVHEVARLLKVKPDTVRIWLRAGRLAGRRAGRLWRIRSEDLEAFVERRKVDDPK